MYQCYYLHMLRDSVSPVSGILKILCTQLKKKNIPFSQTKNVCCYSTFCSDIINNYSENRFHQILELPGTIWVPKLGKLNMCSTFWFLVEYDILHHTLRQTM